MLFTKQGRKGQEDPQRQQYKNKDKPKGWFDGEEVEEDDDVAWM